MLSEVDALVTEDAAKDKLLNFFFVSAFTAKAAPQSLKVRESGQKKSLPLSRRTVLEINWTKWIPTGSKGPQGLHP